MFVERIVRHQTVVHVDDDFHRVHALAFGKVQLLFASGAVDKEFEIACQR